MCNLEVTWGATLCRNSSFLRRATYIGGPGCRRLQHWRWPLLWDTLIKRRRLLLLDTSQHVHDFVDMYSVCVTG